MNAVTAMQAPWANPSEFRDREWLITNGLGGYASGTLPGFITRRYHGIFMPNLARPKGRHLLISRMDDEVILPNNEGGKSIVIAGGEMRGPASLAQRMQWISAITVNGNTVQWRYQLPDAVLEKTMVMPHLRNTVQIGYRLVSGKPLILKLTPFLPLRRQDVPLHKEPYRRFEVINTALAKVMVHAPELDLSLRMGVKAGDAEFIGAYDEVTDQLLLREQLRGYECHETLVSPGHFVSQLEPGEQLVFVASEYELDAASVDIETTLHQERERMSALLEHTDGATDDMIARLAIAADQFIVRPESRPQDTVWAAKEGHMLRSVIAGYHWFSDWGRDTMISLEGLLLCTGRYAEARATLLTFAHYVRDGLLPNMFPEGNNVGLYHTVDASLWYFHAVHRYIQYSRDEDVLLELLPVLRDIVAHHIAGTRFNIHMDPGDALISAGTDRNALTWMDAHMGDWIVTPRRGKPVEIQALWYNALRLMATWEAKSSDQRHQYEEYARRALQSFNQRFWSAEHGHLYDVIDGDVSLDASLRPNQIFTLSLDHPVLAQEHWHAVVNTVREHLLTPVGLRTLARNNPAYRPTYYGDLATRDAAYHQGTVWPWLLGHFVDAWLKVYPDPQQARELLAAFPGHLLEAGVGNISEVFDAQWPHVPHGCIAQAWSVAEILRAWQRTSAPTRSH